MAASIEQLQADPPDDSAFRSLEGLLIQTGNWERLAQASEQVADAVEGPGLRYQFYLKAGRLHEEKLGRLEDAARCYDHAAGVSPGDAEALQALLQLRRNQKKFPLVAVAISNYVDHVHSKRHRVEMLIESAKIRRSHLNDPAGATADLQRALTEDPNYPGFLDAAEEVFGDDVRQFCEFLESLARNSADEVVTSNALERALELYRTRLEDLDSAVRVQSELLGEARPGTPAFLKLLALFKEGGQWQRYAEGLEQQRVALEQQPQPATEQLRQLLRELGEVYDQKLKDTAKAADAYQAFLRVQYDPDVQTRLEELLAEAERWEDLVSLHVRAAERAREDPLQWRQHTLTAAGLCERELKSPERATAMFEQILTRNHTDHEALEALCRLLEARQRWADLSVMCVRFAAVLRQQGKHDEARTYMDSAANVYEFQLSKPAAAAELYEQILEADPNDELVADSLVRVRRAINDPGRLAHALGRFAAITAEPTARRDALVEQGEILLEQVGDLAQAEQAFRTALEADPEHIPALQALQETLRRFGNSGQLLEALDTERDLIDDPPRVAVIQREAAQILEDLGRPTEATKRWESAREIQPGHAPTLYALLALYERAGERHRQAEMLRSLADCDLPPKEQAQVLFTLAQLIETSTADGESVATQAELAAAEGEPALKYTRQAADLDPEHLGAMTYLRARAEEANSFEDAVLLLQREAALTPGAPDKARLLHRAARIERDELADENAAAKLEASAVAVHPRYLEAARPLVDWYYRNQHHQDAEVLFQRFGPADLALENTPLGRSEAFYRYGVTCLELKKPDEALLQLDRAIEEHPQHLDALELVADMHRERANWAQARDAYLAILYIAMERMDTPKQAEVNFTLARIAEASENREEAIQRYNKVIAVDPNHPKAARCLVRLYSEAARWRDAVRAYGILLPIAKNDEEICEIHLAQGELLGGALDDWEEAVGAYAAAVKAQPERTDAREAFARALRKANRSRDAARQYRRLAENEGLPESERVSHWLTAAEIYEELGDADEGQKAYEGALALDGSNRLALGALAKLYERSEEWRELVGVLQTTADLLGVDRKSAKAELHLRAARVLSDRLDDRDGAAGQLRKALDQRPDHLESLEKFAELMIDDPRFDEDALRVHHELLTRDPLRTASLHRLAAAYGRHGFAIRAATLGRLLELLRPGTEASSSQVEIPSPLTAANVPRLTEEDLYQRLLHPSEDHPLTHLLREVDPYAERLFPPNIDAWGVSPDPDSTRPSHVRELTDCIASFFGVGRPVVYNVPSSEQAFGLECTDPPTLIAGGGLIAASRQDAAFILSRVFLHVAAGRKLYVRLAAEAFERLILTVVVFFVGPKEAPALRDRAGAQPEDFTLLKRALPRRVQRQAREWAEEAYAVLRETPGEALREWKRAVEWSADRAALLVTGDVEGTLARVLGGPVPAPLPDDPEEVMRLVAQNPAAVELAQYATSRTFLQLQEELAGES